MDNDGPTARVERTFWTVWYYITEAVNRFFRPEPPNIVRNDPNSIQESADNSEPANCGPTEGDASGREVDEEQHLATASVLSSSRPVVTWEPCTTDIDLGPDEESKTQLSRGSESEASDQGEGTREEQFIQTGNNEVGLLVAKKDDAVHGPNEAPVKNDYEEITGDAKSEDMVESRGKAGAEEETGSTVTLDDQKMDEPTTKIQVMEEVNQMHSDSEQDLKAVEVKLCATTALNLEEEDTMHIEEARVQQHEADTAVMHEEVKDSEDVLLLLASENENKSDDGARQVESPPSVNEELSGDDRDFKEDLSFASLHVELQAPLDKSGIVSKDELIVVGQESVMAQRSESDKDEDAKEKEDEIEQENVNEAANNQTIDEMPEQDIKSATEDSEEEDSLITHVMCREEVVQNVKTAEFTDGEQEDVAKDATRESDGVETCAEDTTERAVTLDDQNMDETMIKIQVQEDEKMHHEDEQDLKMDEVKLCTVTALSLEEEDTMHIEEARVQQHEADTAVMHEEVKDSDSVLLLLASENENKSDDGARQVESQLSVHEELSNDDRDFKEDPSFASLHVEFQTALDKSGIVFEDELIVVGQESVMAKGSESDKDEDAKEKEDEIEQENVNEAANNQTIDEVPEQDIKSATEDSQEEDSLTTHMMCVEEVVQNVKTAEFTDGEQEDVAKDATRESDGVETCAEDTTERAVTLDDQNMDETMIKIQVQEDEKMHHEDEQDLKTDEVKLCTVTALSLEEEDTMHIEEARVQQHEADTAVMHEEVKDSDSVLLLLASENENKSDDGARQVESQLSVHEELSNDDRDFKEDLSFASLHVEFQTALDKSGIVFEDELIVVGQESVMAKGSESDKDEDAKEKEDEIEQENVNEAANNQTIDEVPEQDIKSATEDSQEEDSLTTHMMCVEEVVQNVKTAEFTDGEQEDVAKDATRESDGVETGAEDTTERAVTLDDQNIDETMIKIQVQEDEKMHHEDEQDLKTDEVKLCTVTALSLEEEDTMHIEEARVQQHEADTAVMHEEVKDSDSVLLLLLASENENKSDDGARQVESQLSVHKELSDDDRDFKEDLSFASLHVELQTALDKSGIVFEDELIVVGQESVMAKGSESDKDEDAKEKEDEIEQENVNEAANNQTTDEVPEQDIKDHQEEDISTGHVTCGEEVVQIPKTELHTAEFTDVRQEDVANDSTTRESDDVDTESHGEVIAGKFALTTDIPVDERFFDKDQEEERLDQEGSLEVARRATSVTVKPEGETRQETSTEFKNTPQGICEGRIVVSQQLNSPTCEETQEGVPEYNNEPAEADENTTQRFLEVEDCEEIQQLPEEVESKDSESLQNSGCSIGAEHMEEEQESILDTKESFDLVSVEPQQTEKPLVEPVIQASRLLFEEEGGKLSVDPMKTGIRHSEKEFESDIGLPKEVQDGTEELLVEYELDEGICAAGETLMFLKAEAPETVEPVDATNSDQNSYSLLEDFTESGFLKESVKTEPKLLEDSPVEMVDAGIDMEEMGYGVEEEAAEDDGQKKNEMEILNLQVAAENSSIAESEVVETKDQLSGEVLEISSDGTKISESEPKDLTAVSPEETTKNVTESEGSYAEQTVSPVSGRPDVIDEEILDLWIQAASSEDTDGAKQQEVPKPGQQVDTEIEPSNDEQDEMSSVHSEKGEVQLVESVSDTEMSSSTAESGFSDQSLCEYGTQNSETQQLKATGAGSFQGMSDILADISESPDISEVSTQQPNSQSQDLLMQETLQTRQSYLKEEESGFHTDSGLTSSEARHLDQELDKSQEKSDKETGLEKENEADITDLTRKTDWKDTEVEKTNIEDEPLKTMMSDSLDKIEHTDSGRSRSGSEASLQEGNVSTESGSQDDTCTESELLKLPLLDKPQPRCSEDITDILPELNRAEVAQKPTSESEDVMEVDAFMLDFAAQRSRIAVKNPRVRPPKDPRSLLHMPSVDPMPSSRPPVKVPAGVPLGGLGIGIKLPGLGAGFPVLKKTQRLMKDENSPDTVSQEPETKPVEKSDTAKQDETPHKPKWMPPGHAGFGNPLMSELKNKLKKTTKE